MAQYIQTGNYLDYTPGAKVDAGTVVKIGDNFFGVADRAIPAHTKGALCVSGVYLVPKAAGTINIGAVLYWDDGNSQATVTPVADAYLGRAVATTSGDYVAVLLNGTNLGDISVPAAQSEPSPTQTAIDSLTAADPAAITATAGDSDNTELIADVTAIHAEVVKAVADLGTLKTAVNAAKTDLAAVVAALKTAGIFE
jgi:predicted RecA/RadA family phage recombinase